MIVSVQDVEFSYTGRSAKFSFPHFAVEAGSTVSIVGRSGFGKTTLLKLLLGLLRPSSGSIKPPSLAKNGGIGVVGQDTFLVPWLDCEQNIKLPMRFSSPHGSQGRNSDAIPDAFRELVGSLGLENHLSKFPHEMSGGIRRRTELARAFMLSPKALILDEPFAGLDVDVRDSIFESLLSHQNAHETGIVLVTHDLLDAAMISDAVYYFPEEGILGENPIRFERNRSLCRRRFDSETVLIAKEIERVAFTPEEEG